MQQEALISPCKNSVYKSFSKNNSIAIHHLLFPWRCLIAYRPIGRYAIKQRGVLLFKNIRPVLHPVTAGICTTSGRARLWPGLHPPGIAPIARGICWS